MLSKLILTLVVTQTSSYPQISTFYKTINRGKFELPEIYRPLSQRINVKKTTSSKGGVGGNTESVIPNWSSYTLEELTILPDAYLCKKRSELRTKSKVKYGGSKKQQGKEGQNQGKGWKKAQKGKKGWAAEKESSTTTPSNENDDETDEIPVQDCCLGKDKACFTLGGCFCDESCQHFDDCCPDYDFTCSDTFKLCLNDDRKTPKLHPDSNQNKIQMQAKKDVKSSQEEISMNGILGQLGVYYEYDTYGAGADNAIHVKPDSCCGPRKYNSGEQCCCMDKDSFLGTLVDGPCNEYSCI